MHIFQLACALWALGCLLPSHALSQSAENHWSNTERQLRYEPSGTDFVIVNGTKRFNRALYGTHTAFRIETGDLPEFAMYMPGFGGNIRLGIIRNGQSIWLTQARRIEARYKGAAMDYLITDPLLGDAVLTVHVLALSDAEGMVVKVLSDEPLPDVSLVCVYGGGTGKKFRRDGDMNTDPESIFYLTPQNCNGTVVEVADNRFVLQYGNGREFSDTQVFSGDDTLRFGGQKEMKKLVGGFFPSNAQLQVGDAASALKSPIDAVSGTMSDAPVLVGKIDGIDKNGHCLLWKVPQTSRDLSFSSSAATIAFRKAEDARRALVGRVVVQTPDAYINTLGPTLAAAADGIWEHPTYLHGAIGWRMRLNGWRGPYTADPLGWHDRAQAHIAAYAKSQVTSPDSGPSVPDPETNWARQEEKMGNALFTSGYICRNPNGDFRPHHYDMNLVFIDNMLRHFRWTGDKAFMRDMWPVLTRHLAWEKRNFDGDGDGLYDAYCCIWASDALQYGGGGVAHSSAYNYLANKMAAQIATVLNFDPAPYQAEAGKILKAIRSRLWLPGKGWFAEYVDWTGLKRTHDASALWTIYHVLDSEVADPFQAWQSSRYVETNLPKLPVKGTGLEDGGYYVHSTTSWQPYDWSINNVVMAENLHMALAHWQAGRGDEAFLLWKSTLLDAMYLGGSPGNFVQLSFLDAARGEMYRDFADEVGMTARSLVEGLFGIMPDGLEGKLSIKPGFPAQWDFANLKTPYIDYRFQRKGLVDRYQFVASFPNPLALTLKIEAKTDGIAWVKVNGKKAVWKMDPSAIGLPVVVIDGGKSARLDIEIKWIGAPLQKVPGEMTVAKGQTAVFPFENCSVMDVYDPQTVLSAPKTDRNRITGLVGGELGTRTIFARVKQGQMEWWMPVAVKVAPPVEVLAESGQPANTVAFSVKNNLQDDFSASVIVNHHDTGIKMKVTRQSQGNPLQVDAKWLMVGSNLVQLVADGRVLVSETIENWGLDALADGKVQRTIGLENLFNDKVTRIFQNEYLSPRWPFPTLQLPKHGVGNWCYHSIHPVIDDSGLRKQATAGDGKIRLPLGVTFESPAMDDAPNIAFASLYDNFPDSVVVPLNGNGRRLYLLMAGSTNPMQSQIANGVLAVTYADGSRDTLELKNPDNWSPIEQDYFHDGFAFHIATPPQPRLHLKTGLLTNRETFTGYMSINGYSNRVIDGGAANIVDLPVDPNKQLASLTLRVLSNEVVMGIMAVTVVE
ncbi:MAG: DUF4450 domain-containing protein [Breznakibacter sp.]